MNSDGNTIFPDEGNEVFYLASKCDIRMCSAWEESWLEIRGDVGLEVLGENDIALSDDICSRGGIFYSAKASDMGAADIDLYVSHLEKCSLGRRYD